MVATLIREAPASYGRGERRTDHAGDRTSAQQRATSDQTPASAQQRATSDQPRLSEATLTRLWAGQRFPASALVTRQGVLVRVLHPGRRGRGAGPDFRDALIATPSGGLLSGDVELHVRASDFHAHGHDRDRRYDGVVLHFVFDAGVAEDTLLANGCRVPVVALAPWLRRRREELAGWLAHPSLWREPCHDAIARLGREEVLRSLEELGDRRFREREAALAASLRAVGAGEALYRALLAGLGYGGERERFEAVAAALPWRELTALLAASPDAERGVLAEALLLGTAGLLPSQRGETSRHAYEQELEERWRALGRASPPAGSPQPPVAVRPANHPARRLAGLAQLLARHGADSESLALPPETLDGPPSRLVAGWTVPAEGYWRQHVAPGV
ncbi:MAG: DUF2851 family protein [Chloroflexi bacterium]|nr:DUF2851 family protein [Chloroflexota bacterium]